MLTTSNNTSHDDINSIFQKEIEVKWSDCDPNRHLRHSSYADYAAHVRLCYLAQEGFPPERFAEEGIGPIFFREESQFLREVMLMEKLTVNFKVSAFSEDNSRWRVFHEFKKENGKRAAIVQVDGAWIDLKSRKLTLPPQDLQTIMNKLEVGKIPKFPMFAI